MTRLKDQIDEADCTHDIRDVVGSKKRTILCPLPQHRRINNTPSFSIYWKDGKQWWKCHGNCQLEGDLVDLVGYLRVTGYDRRDPAKVREALALVDSRYEFKIVEPPRVVTLDGNEWTKFSLTDRGHRLWQDAWIERGNPAPFPYWIRQTLQS